MCEQQSLNEERRRIIGPLSLIRDDLGPPDPPGDRDDDFRAGQNKAAFHVCMDAAIVTAGSLCQSARAAMDLARAPTPICMDFGCRAIGRGRELSPSPLKYDGIRLGLAALLITSCFDH